MWSHFLFAMSLKPHICAGLGQLKSFPLTSMQCFSHLYEVLLQMLHVSRLLSVSEAKAWLGRDAWVYLRCDNPPSWLTRELKFGAETWSLNYNYKNSKYDKTADVCISHTISQFFNWSSGEIGHCMCQQPIKTKLRDNLGFSTFKDALTSRSHTYCIIRATTLAPEPQRPHAGKTETLQRWHKLANGRHD